MNPKDEIREYIFVCPECNEEFDYADAMDLEWDLVHHNWIEEIGEENIYKAIYSKIRHEKTSIRPRYKKIDEKTNEILTDPFLNYSCVLLYGLRYQNILDIGEAWMRDHEINKLLI